MAVNYALDALLVDKDKKMKELEKQQSLFQQLNALGIQTPQMEQVQQRITAINTDLSSLDNLIRKASWGVVASPEEQLAASAWSAAAIADTARAQTDSAIDRVTQNYQDFITRERRNQENVVAGIGAATASQEWYAIGNANRAWLPPQVAAAQAEQVTSTANQQIAQAQALSDQKILQAMDGLETRIAQLQAQQTTTDLNAQNQLTNALAQYNALKQYQASRGGWSGWRTTTTSTRDIVADAVDNASGVSFDPTKLAITDNKTTIDWVEYTIEAWTGWVSYLKNPAGNVYPITGYTYTWGAFVPTSK